MADVVKFMAFMGVCGVLAAFAMAPLYRLLSGWNAWWLG